MNYVAAIPIAGPEARLKRGLYQMRMFEIDEAMADLDAAIAGGCNDARAYWARGKCATMGKGPKAGVEDLQKAVGLEPLNPIFRYDLSNALAGRVSIGNRFGKGGVTVGSGDDEARIDNPEAKQQAGLAMELDPENDRYREWFERFQ